MRIPWRCSTGLMHYRSFMLPYVHRINAAATDFFGIVKNAVPFAVVTLPKTTSTMSASCSKVKDVSWRKKLAAVTRVIESLVQEATSRLLIPGKGRLVLSICRESACSVKKPGWSLMALAMTDAFCTNQRDLTLLGVHSQRPLGLLHQVHRTV